MNVAKNIKKLREKQGMLQKQVALEIGLKPAHYNKIENGIVEPSISILKKLSSLYGVTIDQIVNLESEIPKEVVIKDKNLIEKIRLIDKLNKKDKNIIFSIIDTMLTKQKFKDFFNKNIATL